MSDDADDILNMPDEVYQHLLARSRAVSREKAMTVDEFRTYAGQRRQEWEALRRTKVAGEEV